MFKKIFVSLLILGMILPVGSVMASNILAKGKPTATPTQPTEPPVPTETPDTGSLYGDLYVILRDENGVPILNTVTLDVPETGEENVSCIQPISAVTDSVEIETWDGPLPIDAYAGEPFALPSYIDIAGDLVECELTEEMATWVQAVDFGRLNLGRAPDAVIEHAFDEAINKMNAATAFALDPAGRLMLELEGEWFTIDAPAENLALYIKMMVDGHWITTDTTPDGHGGGGGKGGGGGRPEGDGPSTEPRPVLWDSAITLLGAIGYANLGSVDNTLNNHDLLLAASLLAGSADKTGTMTLDKVIYINSVYGINQNGTLVDEKGNSYFDFSVPYGGNPYIQDRARTYGTRNSGDCALGYIWVLQPVEGRENYYVTECVSILGEVHFNDYKEYYRTLGMGFDYLDNVRGFAQSADDALQALEFIHNYKVPEVLYAE